MHSLWITFVIIDLLFGYVAIFCGVDNITQRYFLKNFTKFKIPSHAFKTKQRIHDDFQTGCSCLIVSVIDTSILYLIALM